MKWWGYVLIGAVLALAGAALYAGHATKDWRTELGAARARSASRDSTIARYAGEIIRLRQPGDTVAKHISDSIGHAAADRADAAERRERRAKAQLAAAKTAVDSLPIALEALAQADSAKVDRGRQVVLLEKDTAQKATKIRDLNQAVALSGASLRLARLDRDEWKEKAERKPLTEITGKWFLGLPRPGFHLVAGVSSCPVKSLCVTAGVGF